MDARLRARRSRWPADGEVVWSWPPDAGVKRVEMTARDGGYQARYPEESAR
jgi:hypothetical protein